MKRYLLLLALTVLVCSEVVVLDDSNYTSFVSTHPYVFVKFYAPWCGHCKSLAPAYEKLGEAAAGKEYVIAKVDSTLAEKVSQEVGVEGYPTLKFIANGFAVDYDGPRTAQGIQSWIETFLKSKIASLSELEVKEKIGSEDFLLIQGATEEQLKVLQIANAVDNTVEYYLLSSGEPKLTLYLKNSKTFEFTKELTVKALAKWTRESTLPTVVPLLSKDHVKLVFENEEKLPSLLLLRNKDFSDEAFNRLTSICEEGKSEFNCAYVDQTHEIFGGVGKFLKSDDDKTVLAYLVFGMKAGYSFPNPNDITKESLLQFISEVKEGKIEKLIDADKDKKDKEIRYANVVKLTADNYNQTLADNQYVFVEYYSNTCGHCVSFAPEYEKLATQLKGDKSEYVIAAVDLSVEEEVAKWVSVQGYPTLKFFVKGVELDYSGNRKAADIVAFMDRAVKTKLQVAQSVQEIPKPAVAIFAVPEDSPLQLLPMVFTQLPIYHIVGGDKSTFKLEIHAKEFSSYGGQTNLKDIAAWLEETTEPVIVSVVQATPTKKLTKALETQTPLLVVVKRDGSAEQVLSVLESYCVSRVEFLCGVATKGDQDYDSFNSWLEDFKPDESRLVYLTTDNFQKYFYGGDLKEVNKQSLDAFLNDIKEGKLKAHAKKVKQEDKEEKPKEEVKEATQEEAKQESNGQPAEVSQSEDSKDSAAGQEL